MHSNINYKQKKKKKIEKKTYRMGENDATNKDLTSKHIKTAHTV